MHIKESEGGGGLDFKASRLSKLPREKWKWLSLLLTNFQPHFAAATAKKINSPPRSNPQ
jgi:hypothetical protein